MSLKRFTRFVLFVILFYFFLIIFLIRNNFKNIQNLNRYKFIEKSVRNYSNFILNENFYENHNWMFNFNLIQYSSYFIVENQVIKQIESMVYVESHKLESENLKCLLVSTYFKKVFIIEPSIIYKTKQLDIRKVICKIYNSVGINKNDRIGIAIINKNDFNFDKNDMNPIEMINYQIPSYIYVREPRLPQVAMCVQYISNAYP
jgi:hypothetical protein